MSGSITRRRSCSSSRSPGRAHIRCCIWINTKAICKPTRIAAMLRFTSEAILSRSGAGLIAADGSLKLPSPRRTRGSRRKPYSGSPGCMRSSHGSKTKRQTSSLRPRQAEALPVLAQFRRWLDANVIGLLPQAPLAKAFGYALRHWEALIRYTENGVLLPDNNALERQIRPIALGRSNWMFAASPRGARAAATMYSLIGTARLNGIEPYAWLERTLEQLPSYPVTRVHELLPLAR